jgi:hypothetical protein
MRWEYRTLLWDARKGLLGGKIDREELDDQLNLLGEEGWELVSAATTTIEGGSTRDVLLILKRSMAAV